MVKTLPALLRYAAPAWLALAAGLLLACGTTGCISPLHKAIRADDPVAVRSALAQKNLEVNGSAYREGWTRSGLTPLGYAVQRGRTEAARALLDAGADVNVRMAWSPLAVTPLGIAAATGPLAMVQLLLERGAEVNAGYFLLPPLFVPFGVGNRTEIVAESPLLLALRAGHKDIVRALLGAGADVNLQASELASMRPDVYGPPVAGPPIQVAAAERDVDTVRLLLERGARVDAPVRTLLPMFPGPPGPPLRTEEPFSRWFLYTYDVQADVNTTAYYDILQMVLPQTRGSRPANAAVLFSTNVMVTLDGRACGAPPEGVDEIEPGTHTVEVKAVRLPRFTYANLRLEPGAIPAQSLTFEAGRYYLLKPVLERLGSGRLVPRGVELLCF